MRPVSRWVWCSSIQATSSLEETSTKDNLTSRPQGPRGLPRKDRPPVREAAPVRGLREDPAGKSPWSPPRRTKALVATAGVIAMEPNRP